MEICSDLHIHVGRAYIDRPVKITASRQMTVARILEECRERKGIGMAGIIDCGSPFVLKDLDDLAESGEVAELPRGGLLYRNETVLILGSEVEVGGDRGGSAHLLAYLPTLNAAKAWSRYLENVVTNPTLSTQRASVSARAMHKAVLSMDGELIIAHAFTPHKSVYGTCADRLSILFDDISELGGVELGLSSDSNLADRIAELGTLGFLSNSDAHSLEKIAREYNVMNLPSVDFLSLFDALRVRNSAGIVENCGLDPRLGKYHRTFCEDCGSIAADIPPVSTCPKCGSGSVVKGVLDRIVEIQDTSEPDHPPFRPPYKNQIPLEMIPGIGKAARDKLLRAFSSEMNVLRKVDERDLASVIGVRAASAVVKAREGSLSIAAGGGGIYGKVQ